MSETRLDGLQVAGAKRLAWEECRVQDGLCILVAGQDGVRWPLMMGREKLGKGEKHAGGLVAAGGPLKSFHWASRFKLDR